MIERTENQQTAILLYENVHDPPVEADPLEVGIQGFELRFTELWNWPRLRRVKGCECIGALKALGEESRLRILRMLLEKEQSVNALSAALHISPYNVSKHLSILRHAGLITCRKAGRERLYSVAEHYRVQTATGKKRMDLGCCSFEMDSLPQ